MKIFQTFTILNIQKYMHVIGIDLSKYFILSKLMDINYYVRISIEHMQRVRHANRGRLLLRTPGPVPLLGLACVLMSRPISPELVLSPDF